MRDVQEVIDFLKRSWFSNSQEVEKAKEIIDQYIRNQFVFQMFAMNDEKRKEISADDLSKFIQKE